MVSFLWPGNFRIDQETGNTLQADQTKGLQSPHCEPRVTSYPNQAEPI